jgi:hypothetical protein
VIDLRLLETLPPALFATPMLRMDTCVMKHVRAFDADGKFFAENPQRRLYIRGAFDDEFNMPMDINDYMQIPQMQALVTKLHDGVHLVAFVYYGRALVNTPIATDADVAQVLAAMQRQIGGHGGEEWTRFVRKASDNQQQIDEAVSNAASQKRMH